MKVLGLEVVESHAIAGGDINEALGATLADGRRVFVKTNASAPADMFEREAEGLRWLASAQALRVPEVIEIQRDALVLELITSGERAADYDELLGRGLATLHQKHPRTFGFRRDNYIGTLKQTNASPAYQASTLTQERLGPAPIVDEPSAAERYATNDWATFYRDYRLGPMISRARTHFDARAHLILDTLLDRLPDLVGEPEPPARLHGDLWSGNVHVDENGAPCLIDPAVYGGHREVDLAMMRLFGGFSERVFEAYAEAYPLLPNAEERTKLYQLYPLLVHVNLFGGSYVAQAVEAAKAYI